MSTLRQRLAGAEGKKGPSNKEINPPGIGDRNIAAVYHGGKIEIVVLRATHETVLRPVDRPNGKHTPGRYGRGVNFRAKIVAAPKQVPRDIGAVMAKVGLECRLPFGINELEVLGVKVGIGFGFGCRAVHYSVIVDALRQRRRFYEASLLSITFGGKTGSRQLLIFRRDSYIPIMP